jgi:hypothetical protein
VLNAMPKARVTANPTTFPGIVKTTEIAVLMDANYSIKIFL